MAKRSRLRRVLFIFFLLATVLLAATAGILAYLAPRLEESLAAVLSEKTGRPVELAEFTWSIWPQPGFVGRGLVIGSRPDEDAPPATEVGEFTVRANFAGLLAPRRVIDSFRVSDVIVRVHRRAKAPEDPAPEPPVRDSKPPRLPVDINQVEAENVRIEIIRAESEQPPRIFLIQRLILESLDFEKSVPYKAWVINPRPEGDLYLEGAFGPWNAEEPRLTPYYGAFHLKQADMSVFKGILGLIDVQGDFKGSLQDTHVDGVAELPDFSVAKSGNIVPLRSRFSARVRDGGREIELEKVETEFLNSLLVARGSVSRESEEPGRTVRLNVSTDKARVEDFVQFAVKSDEPPLTGAIQMETDLLIPPGKQRFIERLNAEGRFQIREGRFSKVSIQDTLAKISQIGGGSETEAQSGSSVVSNMTGRFNLVEEEIHFSELAFGVPGMQLDLTGKYTIPGETLDFQGTALLERAPSEMVSGRLSDWIKILDPILGGGKGGTQLPIIISGTRSKPRFSVDFKRLGRQP